MLRQSIVEFQPCDTGRNPDMHFRVESRRIVKGSKRKSEPVAVERFQGNPRPTMRTEVTPKPFRRSPSRCLALNPDSSFRKTRNGEEWRAHRPLADTAMTDTHTEGRGLDAKSHRAARTPAFIGWREVSRVGRHGASTSHLHAHPAEIVGLPDLHAAHAENVVSRRHVEIEVRE